MLAAFTATVFLGAALLFLIQPMFARMVLPLLGGSPSVWNTAMVFFQAVLLAGYGYVHWSSARLATRRQLLLHIALIATPLLVLPIAIPQGWSPPADRNPVAWLLLVLTFSVGLPFFVVSTTGPLLQKWFARTGHRSATDPYFLYAASNLGSMIGLIGYPLLLETSFRLTDQSMLWSLGYGALVGLVSVCAIAVWRTREIASAEAPPLDSSLSRGAATTEAITAGRRLRWVLLSLAPSSLMLGVTTHLSSDIAAIPLLWVVPLAIYLLTFSLAFARKPLLPRSLALRALPILVLPLAIVLATRLYVVWVLVPLHLLVQFVATMACHRELADGRPNTRHLTEFYLWIAVGGVLGGAFNALIAPLIFTSVVEYSLALVLIALLVPPIRPLVAGLKHRILDIALPLSIAVGIVFAIWVLRVLGSNVGHVEGVLFASLVAFLLLRFSRRPLRFGLGLAVLLLEIPFHFGAGLELHAERSFFGVHRVLLDPANGLHRLMHGTTMHGMQSLDPDRRGEPLGYYHRQGPIGQVFETLASPARNARVAVAGLGAGSLAAYAAPGQDWTFYEIDPVVERIARDTRYFTHLADCRAKERVVLGDARLSLARAKDARYELMVLDAYSSDAIPVHLITREALRLYVERLAPGGTIAFHVSNRYFDLVPVVARLAADAGMACLIRDDTREPGAAANLKTGAIPSTYAVLARTTEDLGPLASDPRWKPMSPRPEDVLWTDDFASPLRALRWREPELQAAAPRPQPARVASR